MIFNTVVSEDGLKVLSNYDNDDLLVPTLFIKNKHEFNKLLASYVEKALSFYDDSNFLGEIISGEAQKEGKGISKEKNIMTLLWSNATVDDFNDPCSYLRKRIAFFDLGIMDSYKNPKIIGYSDILGSDIGGYICKNRIEYETLYSMQFFLNDVESNKTLYEFPIIYFGIDNNIAYFYAI